MKKYYLDKIAPKGRNHMYTQSNTTTPQGKEKDEPLLGAQSATDTRNYIDEIGIPYIRVNHYTDIVDWNYVFIELTDMRPTYLNGSSLEELATHDELLSLSYHLVAKVHETNKGTEADFEEGDMLVRVRALTPCENGDVYVVFENRSLQKQFENLLTFHHQMEAVSHIAAGVAHELRNPLSVIKGFMQLAKLTGDHEKYYDTVISELNRMNNIIEDFLSVSRKKIDRKQQSPVHIMESLIEIIKAECLLHDVNLTLEISEVDQVVYVNESMVKQVMLNLLRNSIEAYGGSNTSRKFKIESYPCENVYKVIITDNGKGMPKHVLEQLGKPFFTTKESGTGIGIPLCKKIIEDHGGEFTIESELNVGTTVTLTLPFTSYNQ
ncbi:nitrogen regulation protein NR(II) [Alkalihalophilus sp. As8PL]|uniref:histidine kinase n=1 Tax=Alkalihalophilus sp. As8PL TaxID=3237103 RepID=A0AB39BV19_9BACI